MSWKEILKEEWKSASINNILNQFEGEWTSFPDADAGYFLEHRFGKGVWDYEIYLGHDQKEHYIDIRIHKIDLLDDEDKDRLKEILLLVE